MDTKFMHIKTWFDDYVKSFKSDDPKVEENFALKIHHTNKVLENAEILAAELQLDSDALYIARLSALLHDVGRFEQLQIYKTFADKMSVDHAELGLQILEREKILKDLPGITKSLITTAIKYHNKLEVPKELNPEEQYFTRLLRDSDKLDIFRVVIEYYENLLEDGEQNHTLVLGLPDNDDYSQEVIDEILNKEIVRSQNLKTVNDFKLLQMAWIFDINFVPTYRIIREKKIIEIIYSHLPKTSDVQQTYEIIREYLDKNCNKEKKSILF